eukprot:11380000-Alexandrium_andersonii.AAC.1
MSRATMISSKIGVAVASVAKGARRTRLWLVMRTRRTKCAACRPCMRIPRSAHTVPRMSTCARVSANTHGPAVRNACVQSRT